jgi:nucleoid-associated protein YgaU
LDALFADLAAEYAAQPRPFTYTFASGPDNSTLSGVSRLFYGRAGRWKDIYEANKAVISNPDNVRPGTQLVIPR